MASHVLHRLLVPRHPPFALDNLTTKNKMLASTVQFSTNDQPTTRTAPHQTPGNTTTAGSPKRYEGPDHAWHRNNNHDPQTALVVLSGPNRVLIIFFQPHQHQPFRHPTKECVLGVPAVAGKKLASVSACEHPDPTCADRGLLDRFPGLVAP